jgi:transposase-like protein
VTDPEVSAAAAEPVVEGLTIAEISAHLAEVDGARISRETISKLTDARRGGDGRLAVPAAGRGRSG